MVERRIDAELRLDNRRRVLVAGLAKKRGNVSRSARPKASNTRRVNRPKTRQTDRGQVDLCEDQSGTFCNFAGNRDTHLGRSTLTPFPVGGKAIVPLGFDRFGQSGGIAISTAPTVSMPR
jgi:hypothetical protein